MEPDTQTYTTTHTGQSPMNNEKGEEPFDLLARVKGVSQELDNSINSQSRASSNSAASNSYNFPKSHCTKPFEKHLLILL